MKKYPAEVIDVANKLYGQFYGDSDLKTIEHLGHPDKYWRIFIDSETKPILQSEEEALNRINEDTFKPIARVEYVLGFYFSTDKKTVVLIKKNRPVEFNGKINGVGGKIEKDESPYDAMVREFKEETGLVVLDWRKYAQLQSDTYNVHVFSSFGNLEPTSVTDEIVSRFNVVDALTNPIHKKTDSFSWLVPMGLDTDVWFSNTYKTK